MGITCNTPQELKDSPFIRLVSIISFAMTLQSHKHHSQLEVNVDTHHVLLGINLESVSTKVGRRREGRFEPLSD